VKMGVKKKRNGDPGRTRVGHPKPFLTSKQSVGEHRKRGQGEIGEKKVFKGGMSDKENRKNAERKNGLSYESKLFQGRKKNAPYQLGEEARGKMSGNFRRISGEGAGLVKNVVI